ncbi:YchJ family protein [Rhodococcus daqingensis]|uniref:UPF0225 protein ACFQS9_18215 n=1 Tax=Rhodococcus daqingensis TaxID=2479363 RepID=A0ABW2S153_9NOCA
MIASTSPCPCLSGDTYGSCCGRFHSGETEAPTAERLMRSRYSAFAVGATDYLRRTWHPSTRPDRLDLDPDQRWTGLDILGCMGGGLFEAEGTVEFVAHYVHAGQRDSLREHSRFVREDGRWLYLDAID